jgi:predicted Zn finger-like uncharacterized protein
MIKVHCTSCQAPYSLEERRVPAAGLRMKCPACGTSFTVTKDGAKPVAAALAPSSPDDFQFELPDFGAGGTPAAPAPAPAPDPFAGQPFVSPFAPEASPARSAERAAPLDLELALPGAPPEPTAPRRVPSPAPLAPEPLDAGFGGGFGELDLPLVAPDLPASRASGRPFAVPLSSPVPPEPSRPAEPPPSGRPSIPSAELSDFGELDLPLVAPDAGLPAVSVGLPVPAPVGLPVPAPAGLPVPAPAGLPVPAPAGLPVPAPAGFPAPAPAGFPAPAPVGLPAPGGGELFPTMAGTGLPAVGGGELLPAEAELLPAPVRPGGKVVGADLYFDSDAGGAAVSPGEGRNLPPPAPAPFDLGFDLGEPPPSAPPPLTLAAPTAPSAAEVGDEVDLGGGASPGTSLDGSLGLGDVGMPPAPLRPAPAPAAPAAPAKPPRRWGRILIPLFVAGSLGGASLSFWPDIGPFGSHLVSDWFNAAAHAQALEALRTQAQGELDTDLASAVPSVLASAKAAAVERPRHRPTLAYAAFLHFSTQLRFGKDPGEDAWGAQQLAIAESVPSVELELARAAREAVSGDLTRARQMAEEIVGKRQSDVDALALVAEIDLKAKSVEQGLSSAARAAEGHASARTHYLVARAQKAQSEVPEPKGPDAKPDPKAPEPKPDPKLAAVRAAAAKAAEAAAKQTLAASPKHAGARLVLAALTASEEPREKEVLDLLQAVTAGDAQPSASKTELVLAHTLLGYVHLDRSRYSLAEQGFTKALALDPQHVAALVGSGRLFENSARFSEAYARYEAASKLEPDNLAAKVGIGRSLLGQDRLKEGRDLLRKAVDGAPRETQALYALGLAEQRLGNRREAEDAFLAATKFRGDMRTTIDAYVALASELARAGRNEEAFQRLAEADGRFPQNADLHGAKGDVALNVGRYDEAKREFETALQKRDDPALRFKLGVTLRRMRAFEAALKVFDKVEELDKNFPGLALERGVLFEEMGQTERALAFFSAALAKAPNDPDLQLRVAATQVAAGQWKLAEPTLRQMVKERPQSAEAHFFLGRALLLAGATPADMLREFERATDLDGQRAEYWMYVGWASNEAGNVAKAESALKRALDLDRSLGDAYWQRGVLLHKQGATVDAIDDLQKALSLRPSRLEAWATLALCYQDQSNWAEAERSWRKAISGNDGVADWHYRLGKLLFQHGDPASALVELEKAVDLAEKSEKQRQFPRFDAHLIVADLLKGRDAAKAIIHYKKFLALAPSDNAYRSDAEKQIVALGGKLR